MATCFGLVTMENQYTSPFHSTDFKNACSAQYLFVPLVVSHYYVCKHWCASFIRVCVCVCVCVCVLIHVHSYMYSSRWMVREVKQNHADKLEWKTENGCWCDGLGWWERCWRKNHLFFIIGGPIWGGTRESGLWEIFSHKSHHIIYVWSLS